MFSTIYFEPWKKYTTPIVRQLAFAIASPNLIHFFPDEIQLLQKIDLHKNTEWQKFYQAYQPRLAELDQNPSELSQFLSQIKSTRLGLRFEALLWFWLKDPENHFFNLLGHSIQSHQNGKTLGEIDFLIKNLTTGQVEHWEVCLKYYLAESDLSLATWIGLNPEDTFEHKLSHFTNKQFQFESALGYPIETRKVVIKGQLYLPQQHGDLPNWINTQRRLGQWQETIPKNPTNLLRLSRPEWICPNLSHTIIPPIYWWTNGLYYQVEKECFTMLRLKQVSNIFIN